MSRGEGAGPVTVSRLDLGCFVRPGEETARGTARFEPVLGYLVRHPRGVLLLDTGMGEDAEVDAHYRPRRVDLAEALRRNGSRLDEVDVVVNCHLHFDHCGGNPRLAGRPVFVQARELAAARGQDYTLPQLVDVPGLRYQELDGEHEVWPGVLVLPTPGHTDGHQSVVIRAGDGAVTVLAGQSHDTATDFAADALAVRASSGPGGPDERVPPPAPWVARLLDLDPRIVHFAHDGASWVPDRGVR